MKPLKVQCETLQNLGLQHAMEMNDKEATLANLMKVLYLFCYRYKGYGNCLIFSVIGNAHCFGQ